MPGEDYDDLVLSLLREVREDVKTINGNVAKNKMEIGFLKKAVYSMGPVLAVVVLYLVAAQVIPIAAIPIP